MPSNARVTLGEVGRKVDSLAISVSQLAERVDERPSWQDVQRIEDGNREARAHLVERVADLESWQMWAGRLILGTVGSGVLAAVFVFKP